MEAVSASNSSLLYEQGAAEHIPLTLATPEGRFRQLNDQLANCVEGTLADMGHIDQSAGIALVETDQRCLDELANAGNDYRQAIEAAEAAYDTAQKDTFDRHRGKKGGLERVRAALGRYESELYDLRDEYLTTHDLVTRLETTDLVGANLERQTLNVCHGLAELKAQEADTRYQTNSRGLATAQASYIQKQNDLISVGNKPGMSEDESTAEVARGEALHADQQALWAEISLLQREIPIILKEVGSTHGEVSRLEGLLEAQTMKIASIEQKIAGAQQRLVEIREAILAIKAKIDQVNVTYSESEASETPRAPVLDGSKTYEVPLHRTGIVQPIGLDLSQTVDGRLRVESIKGEK